MDYAAIVATIRRPRARGRRRDPRSLQPRRLRRSAPSPTPRRSPRRTSSPTASSRGGLAAAFPEIPVVTEEQVEAATACRAPVFFLVDPLDGTKEFVQRRGDFTVNIALIENGVPTRGVVYAPAQGRLFYTDADGRSQEEAGPHGADAGALTPLSVGDARPGRAGRRRLEVAPRQGDRRLYRPLQRRRLPFRRLVAEVLPGRRRRGRPLPAARPHDGVGHRRRPGGAARRRRSGGALRRPCPARLRQGRLREPVLHRLRPGRRARWTPDPCRSFWSFRRATPRPATRASRWSSSSARAARRGACAAQLGGGDSGAWGRPGGGRHRRRPHRRRRPWGSVPRWR